MKDLVVFLKENGISFEENVDGKRLCSFRVGGCVKIVAKPQSSLQVKALLDYLDASGMKNKVLGRGSDTVISDEGFDGALVLLTELKGIKVDGDMLSAGAGESLASVASFACSQCLTGLEFAHGIPGSVGGAVYMNAGAYGGEISDVIVSCECYDRRSKSIVVLDKFDLGLSYRHSVLQDKGELVVLSALFKLSKGEKTEIRERMDEYKAKRLASQPLEYPSAGSAFKRPQGHFAAKLIDDAGLKGYTVGGAQVSEKHAGFIINRGGATADDIKDLVSYIQLTVKEKFDVSLEPEIEFLE